MIQVLHAFNRQEHAEGKLLRWWCGAAPFSLSAATIGGSGGDGGGPSRGTAGAQQQCTERGAFDEARFSVYAERPTWWTVEEWSKGYTGNRDWRPVAQLLQRVGMCPCGSRAAGRAVWRAAVMLAGSWAVHSQRRCGNACLSPHVAWVVCGLWSVPEHVPALLVCARRVRSTGTLLARESLTPALRGWRGRVQASKTRRSLSSWWSERALHKSLQQRLARLPLLLLAASCPGASAATATR